MIGLMRQKPYGCHIRSILATTVLAAVLGLAGCEEALPGPSDGPLPIPATTSLMDGQTYVASDALVRGKRLVTGTEIKLRFEGMNLVASAGCRQAEGRYQVEDGLLRAPNLSFTGEACSNRLKAQEDWLLEFLHGPLPAELSSEKARMLYLGDQKLSLTMSSLELDQPDQGRLETTAWTLRQIAVKLPGGQPPEITKAPGLSRNNKATPEANAIPSLQFYDDDQFYIHTACGVVAGTYSFDQRQINFLKGESQPGSCGARRAAFAGPAMGIFNGSVKYRFEGLDLILTQGNISLEFFPS